MRCQDIMSRPVRFCRSVESVQAGAARMHEFNVGFLPILGEGDRVIGVLTDRDIALRVVAKGLNPVGTTVGDVMTRSIVACRPEEDVRRAEELMARHHKSPILVVDGQGGAAGVISLADLAKREEPHAFETIRRVASREIIPA